MQKNIKSNQKTFDKNGNHSQQSKMKLTDHENYSTGIFTGSQNVLPLKTGDKYPNQNWEQIFIDEYASSFSWSPFGNEGLYLPDITGDSQSQQENFNEQIVPIQEPIEPNPIFQQNHKILQQVNFKKKHVKNVNIPKFLCRLLFKYLPNYYDHFIGKQKAWETAIKQAKRLQQWARLSKNNYLSLNHLGHFFNNQTKIQGMDTLLNRRIMNLILRENMKTEVIQNYQLRQKDSYLKTLKIYMIRLRNSELSQRVQSK